MIRIVIIFLLALSFQKMFGREGIVINEIMCSNAVTLFDHAHENSDWIELKNTSDEPVNLKDFRISDANDFSSAWIFPDTTILAGEFIILFASGNDEYSNSKRRFVSGSSAQTLITKSDTLSFAYVETDGDFSMKIKITSINSLSKPTFAGLMMRESLEPDSKFAAIGLSSMDNDKIHFNYRPDTAEESIFIPSSFKEELPDVFFEIRNQSTAFILKYCTRGFLMRDQLVRNIDLNKKLFFGIFFRSGYGKIKPEIIFQSFLLNNQAIDINDIKIVSICDSGAVSSILPSRELHTDFKLNSESESLYLWNNDGQVCDSLLIEKQRTDVSFSRVNDSEAVFKPAYPATAGFENSNFYDGIMFNPLISTQPGVLLSPVNISFDYQADGEEIYYTLDCTTPTETSKRFEGELIKIDTSTVVRAISYKEGYLSSKVKSYSYIISEDYALPVASISLNPKDLTDTIWGIFSNPYKNKYREVPANFEYFDKNNSTYFSTGIGMRPHGQSVAIGLPQKAFRISAKKKFGDANFKYKFFGENSLKSYDFLIFRNSSQDWEYKFLRDAYSQVLGSRLRITDHSRYCPVLTYVNGVFYGLMNLREKIDENYVHTKYKIPYDSITIVDQGTYFKFGSFLRNKQYFESFENWEPDSDEFWDFISDNNNIESFVDFLFLNLLCHNVDWPVWNMRSWQSPLFGNKINWVLNDLDMTFGLDWEVATEDNIFHKISREADYYGLGKSPYAIIKMFKCPKFKQIFLSRTADLLNSSFLSDSMITVLDSLAGNIKSVIPLHQERWKKSIPYWEDEIEGLREYIRERPDIFREHILEYFELKDKHNLTIEVNPSRAAKVRINTIETSNFPWEGIYFENIPVELEIIPNKGYEFIKWEGEANDTSRKISINLKNASTVRAIFQALDNPVGDIVINEIMYKPADSQDSKDWIEIFNNDSIEFNLTDWFITDENPEHKFVFPNGTFIQPGDYLVFVEDTNAFSNVYPDIKNIIGNIDFGFGTNDKVILYNKYDFMIDTVDYSNVLPWDKNADETGYSLELMSPNFDNLIAESWKASLIEAGTPGRENSTFVAVRELKENYLIKVNPNPADDFLIIESKGIISNAQIIRLCDIFGKEVYCSQSTFLKNPIKIYLNNIPSGVYFVTANENGSSSKLIQKVIISH